MELERKYISEVMLNGEIDPFSYIAQIPVVKYFQAGNTLEIHNNITILVGENGTGKSTLMEAIAGAVKLNPEGGSQQHSFSTKDTHSDLFRKLVVSKQDFPEEKFFLRAESVYNFATYTAETAMYGKSGLWDNLHKMSHGEGFIDIMSKWRGRGLYLMDEPESALSPMRLMETLCIMNNLIKNESQFIIATHSPMIMAFPGAQVLQLSENGIEEVDFRDTEHYKITMDFLQNPERMYRILFEE